MGALDTFDGYGLAVRWHGGQWSPLYAFLSTGSVVAGLGAELRACIRDCEAGSVDVDAGEVEELRAFERWAEENEGDDE